MASAAAGDELAVSTPIVGSNTAGTDVVETMRLVDLVQNRQINWNI